MKLNQFILIMKIKLIIQIFLLKHNNKILFKTFKLFKILNIKRQNVNNQKLNPQKQNKFVNALKQIAYNCIVPASKQVKNVLINVVVKIVITLKNIIR